MKKYYMKLYSVPFKKIKDGTKTIEMRLNDDKRKLINIGDTIEFKNIESGETLLVEVTNKYIYEDFNELYKKHDKVSLGYSEKESVSPSDMLAYYTLSDIQKYGVVGLALRLIF